MSCEFHQIGTTVTLSKGVQVLHSGKKVRLPAGTTGKVVAVDRSRHILTIRFKQFRKPLNLTAHSLKTEGRQREEPRRGGRGNYYHIEVREGSDFETFRTQDVGDPGHVQRVAGKRTGGSWATVKWLVSKEDAHVEDDKLIGDTQEAKELIRKLRSQPVQIDGDRFEAKPRRNVPERSKPTARHTRAKSQNIKKARVTQED